MKPVQTYASLTDLLNKTLYDHAHRTALVSLGKSLTYRELDQYALRWAAWLQSQGLQTGSRVAIMLPNVLASPVCLVGSLRAGMVVVNVNPLYTARELQVQLQDCTPEVLVVFESFAATVEKVPKALHPKHIVVVSPGDLLGAVRGFMVNTVVRHIKRKVARWRIDGAVAFTQALASAPTAHFFAPDLGRQDLAFLQYTGGTTGQPRAAMLTHGNIVANILQVDDIAQAALGDLLPEPLTMLTALPLYHIFAMTVCELYAFHAGMRVVLVINPRDLNALTKTWAKESPHIFPAVNTLFSALLAYPPFQQLDFTNLRIALGGGMAVHERVAHQWQTMTGRTIVEGYGMSEASPVIAANPTDAKAFSGTVGYPLPETLVEILNDDHSPAPVGHAGEIAVRGPQVMQGYWNDPQDNAGVFTTQGYLLTGDIGMRNEAGEIRIVDRKKDMILVSGFSVSPAEIDEVCAAHPAIAECAAVGVADDITGEAIRLYVVARSDDLDKVAVIQWARERLTGYKCPREIVLVQSLPKNPVGKVLRRVLRDQSVTS
jgi:long-chain acyl-CoA synthetase